jgi:hypothetical protein
VFVASEGDIVDRRYRVLRISATSVEIEDILNNNRQSIPLTQDNCFIRLQFLMQQFHRRRPQHVVVLVLGTKERGYVLITMMLFVALLAIAALAVATKADFQSRRDREEELSTAACNTREPFGSSSRRLDVIRREWKSLKNKQPAIPSETI